MKEPHGKELIAEYILECRGQGHCLPYVDYAVIDEWLRIAQDTDRLLLVLADVLPKFYEAGSRSGPVRTLAGARNLVIKVLQDRAAR